MAEPERVETENDYDGRKRADEKKAAAIAEIDSLADLQAVKQYLKKIRGLQ